MTRPYLLLFILIGCLPVSPFSFVIVQEKLHVWSKQKQRRRRKSKRNGKIASCSTRKLSSGWVSVLVLLMSNEFSLDWLRVWATELPGVWKLAGIRCSNFVENEFLISLPCGRGCTFVSKCIVGHVVSALSLNESAQVFTLYKAVLYPCLFWLWDLYFRVVQSILELCYNMGWVRHRSPADSLLIDPFVALKQICRASVFALALNHRYCGCELWNGSKGRRRLLLLFFHSLGIVLRFIYSCAFVSVVITVKWWLSKCYVMWNVSLCFDLISGFTHSISHQNFRYVLFYSTL